MKRNLETSSDWIVLNHNMQTLFDWSDKDDELRTWLEPHLQKLSRESRKSIAKRAQKLLRSIS